MNTNPAWPDIRYADWHETCASLHLYSQIVGKYRLAQTPWLNHSWHATTYVTPQGLTTGPIPYDGGLVDITFDFSAHDLIAASSNGKRVCFALEPMSIAEFYERTRTMIASVGGHLNIHGMPNELPDPIAFSQDTAPRPYDADAVARYHQALCRINSVFSLFRTGFLGKVSPVHLFWGAFDLAVTRFSGRSAPRHPGGIPHLPDAVTVEAYSHEVSSAGFWPGGGGVDEAMFYSYAYPNPDGYAKQPVQPADAHFDETIGEFVLPYAAVMSADSPESALMEFLQSTYTAAAVTAQWDRDALECELGQVGVVRMVER
jgi:hypothetical protein